MELKDYTTEELREELKRRRVQAMKEAKKQLPTYKEFTATVKELHNSWGNINGYVYSVKDAEPHNCDIESRFFYNINNLISNLQSYTKNS